MGYDLIPRNKKLDSFHFGMFSWGWMLDQGIGLIIGTGKAIRPAGYSFIPDKLGRDPNHNDGFRVTAEQARAMALAASGLASVKNFINKEWEDMPEGTQAKMKEGNERFGHNIYNTPVSEDFITKIKAFAEWAYNSQGFAIK